mmetsp:Transcript_27336/g.82439  ORF Transcript_27336/g.82439 Transcript_27336/m.82439 type:complete len:343 (+) Transcript_27336:2-1030(+)
MARGPSGKRPAVSRTSKWGSPSSTMCTSLFGRSTVKVMTCHVFGLTVLPHVCTLRSSASLSSSSEPSLSSARSISGISSCKSTPALPVMANRTSSPSYGMAIDSTSIMCSRSSPTKKRALRSTMSAITSTYCLAKLCGFKLSPPPASLFLRPHSPDSLRKFMFPHWLAGTMPTWKSAPSFILKHQRKTAADVLSVLNSIEGPSSHLALSRPLNAHRHCMPSSTSKVACTDRFTTFFFRFSPSGRSMLFHTGTLVKAWCSLPATTALTGLQPVSCRSHWPSSADSRASSSTALPFFKGFLPSDARNGWTYTGHAFTSWGRVTSHVGRIRIASPKPRCPGACGG